MSALMPGWLTRILTDADTAGDVASTLILAADDLEDGKATAGDLRRWGHEIRGGMRDDHAELAEPQPSDVAPVVWRVTGVPEGADARMVGQRYRLKGHAWCWLNDTIWDPSLWDSLGDMAACGYRLVEDAPADPVPAVSKQEADRDV